MYHSLKENTGAFQLYVLCLDDETATYFKTNTIVYPEVVTLRTEDIERQDIALAASKSNRSKVEYYFTLSPCLPLYLLKQYALPHICPLDDPSRGMEILQTMNSATDVAITVERNGQSTQININNAQVAAEAAAAAAQPESIPVTEVPGVPAQDPSE